MRGMAQAVEEEEGGWGGQATAATINREEVEGETTAAGTATAATTMKEAVVEEAGV